MEYVITPPEVVSIAVVGRSERFPVRRIYCVGRNYMAHIREMGGDERDPPFYFAKPADAIVPTGSTIDYPPQTENLHYEVELVAAIGKGGELDSDYAGLHHGCRRFVVNLQQQRFAWRPIGKTAPCHWRIVTDHTPAIAGFLNDCWHRCTP